MRTRRSRLLVAFWPDAPQPGLWLFFLDGLFYPDDIPTLQAFIGCCLILSNKGQRMMVIKGCGGWWRILSDLSRASASETTGKRLSGARTNVYRPQ